MIKFLDLKKINAFYKDQLLLKTEEVIHDNHFILGKEVTEFERNFALFNKSKFCIGVANGLDALILIFKGYIELGILKKGDEVIIPANTYIASILSVLHSDLKPIFVEPNIDSYNIDPSKIEEKITSKTKAILVVHLYGQLADMESIEQIAFKHNLLIVEDCAQSHGINENSTYSKAFSFYPSKNLGCLGDGGAICTNDEKLANILKKLRNYGSEKKYYNEYIGYNSRLDEIQAGFLNIKLPFLKEENEKRRIVAKRYISEIKNALIELPKIEDLHKHIFHLFVVRVENRKHFQEYLLKNQIETVIHYPVAPHKQIALSEFMNLELPITEKIHNEVISIPISSVMEENEINTVIKVLNAYQ